MVDAGVLSASGVSVAGISSSSSKLGAVNTFSLSLYLRCAMSALVDLVDGTRHTASKWFGRLQLLQIVPQALQCECRGLVPGTPCEVLPHLLQLFGVSGSMGLLSLDEFFCFAIV